MELSKCFVCGKAWSDDQDFCTQCHTAKKVLSDMVHAHGQAQFLFGRMAKLVKPSAESSRTEPSIKPAQPFAPAPDMAPIGAKARAKVAEPNAALALPEVRRPSLLPQAQTQPNHLAFLIDLACCALLDLLVFFAIQWVSSRTTSELLRFSLVPIILVLISFSVLYFWLFLGITQKTFGQILTSRRHNT